MFRPVQVINTTPFHTTTFSHKHLNCNPDSKFNNIDWQSGSALNRPPSTQIGYKHSLNRYLFGKGELDLLALPIRARALGLTQPETKI